MAKSAVLIDEHCWWICTIWWIAPLPCTLKALVLRLVVEPRVHLHNKNNISCLARRQDAVCTTMTADYSDINEMKNACAKGVESNEVTKSNHAESHLDDKGINGNEQFCRRFQFEGDFSSVPLCWFWRKLHRPPYAWVANTTSKDIYMARFLMDMAKWITRGARENVRQQERGSSEAESCDRQTVYWAETRLCLFIFDSRTALPRVSIKNSLESTSALIWTSRW